MIPPNVAIFTDLYQLTMMQGYWSAGRREDWASFELFFRKVPESGGYCVAAGIEDALESVLAARFLPEHLEYLASLKLFSPEFLEYLRGVRFTGDIRAIPEGSVVFPHEPILEVRGPLPEAQWLETLLLNLVNFSTLIATKTSRIVQVAKPATVLEFGLRRAQGPNGGLTVSKTAYAAGFIGTSNVEAGFRFGIPLIGTHAHSWVMSFPDEAEAFRAYADAFPDQSVFLIDTYDTIKQGLPHAIAEGLRMAQRGHRLVGLRLDSGDLAYLAKACRKALDQVGLRGVKIVASSDIDEYLIQDLKAQQRPIDVRRRRTARHRVPKAGVRRDLQTYRHQKPDGPWEPKIKVSSNPAKTTIEPQANLALGERRLLGDASPRRRAAAAAHASSQHRLQKTELVAGSLPAAGAPHCDGEPAEHRPRF